MAKGFIPLEKMSKKERKARYAERRGSWEGVKPYTRTIESSDGFSKAKRSREKAKLKGMQDGVPFFCGKR